MNDSTLPCVLLIVRNKAVSKAMFVGSFDSLLGDIDVYINSLNMVGGA